MRRLRGAAALMALVAMIIPPGRAEARDWPVAGGGDKFRSGYNPEETRPFFADGPPAIQPNPEWVTKLSDLPSGVFPMGGLIVAEGKVIVGGASTNSIVALDQETGLPVWRFQPDPRGSKPLPGDGYAGGYPGTNAPWYNAGVVYATFSNGVLYAIDAGSGEKVWRFEVPRAGAPGEVTDAIVPPSVGWNHDKKAHRLRPLRPEVAPYTGDYPKFHSAVGFCDTGIVLVETLDARLYAIRASDGTVLWHRYVGAPDWPGEFVWPEFRKGGVVPSSGRSTRRFEAQPGPGCLGRFVFVPTEDGYVKTFERDTGEFVKAYDALHAGDLGFAHDGGAGNADPRSGDIIINFLNNRVVRLSVPGMKPRWRHSEDAGILSACVDPSVRTTCDVIETSPGVGQDGPIGGGVFGGNLAIDYQHRVIANPNQDGHLYLWRGIDRTGMNPKLVARVPTGKNPLSVSSPRKNSTSFYLPDDGKLGPWVRRTAVLSSAVMGGGVAYFNASWEHAIYGVRYLSPTGGILKDPRVVFKYTVLWDDTFRYPPFGDRFKKPIIDIDLITFGSPALVDGHLYTQANDGSVYSFDLHNPSSSTTRNLAVLGSGLVPFIPKWTDAPGAFDNVWTPADWYKNQVPPRGWRLPAPGMIGIGLLPAGALLLWIRTSRRRPATANARRQRPKRSYWWP